MAIRDDPNATWEKGFRAFRRSRAMLFLPLTLSSVAGFIARGRAGAATPEWLPLAQRVGAGIAILYLVYPFWFQKIIARSSDKLRARGRDPDETVLVVTSALSTLPSTIAFALCIAGGPARHVYYASVVSVIAALYWIWRYRHLYTEISV